MNGSPSFPKVTGFLSCGVINYSSKFKHRHANFTRYSNCLIDKGPRDSLKIDQDGLTKFVTQTSLFTSNHPSFPKDTSSKQVCIDGKWLSLSNVHNNYGSRPAYTYIHKFLKLSCRVHNKTE